MNTNTTNEAASDLPDNAPMTVAQQLDLQQRLDAYRASPQEGSPWEEVRARLQGRQ